MSVSLNRTYFLDIEVWKEYGFTDVNTDTKKLLPIIYAVQRSRIEQVIGTTLYNKLVELIDDNNVTGKYKTLLDDHIIPTMIAWCDWKATFHTTSQITNKTTGKYSDNHIQANFKDENNNLRNELESDANILLQKMKGWLCDEWENIPELYEAVDTDLLSQTIRPHLHKGDGYSNNSFGII